jgi:hypothetical protein
MFLLLTNYDTKKRRDISLLMSISQNIDRLPKKGEYNFDFFSSILKAVTHTSFITGFLCSNRSEFCYELIDNYLILHSYSNEYLKNTYHLSVHFTIFLSSCSTMDNSEHHFPRLVFLNVMFCIKGAYYHSPAHKLRIMSAEMQLLTVFLIN